MAKRLSLSQSSTITWSPDSAAAPAWELRVADTRPLALLARRVETRPEAQGPAVLRQLPDAGVLDALDLGDQRGGRLHQRRRFGPGERLLPEAGDRRLLGGAALEALLGDLALGDVVENAVPDGDAVGVELEHRLIEDPDDLAVAGQHAVVERRRVAGPDDLLRLLLQGPLRVLGMDPTRPQRRVGEPFLRGVAEDLLDLGADVAPAAVLAELGRVDDRRQPLDQDPVVLLGPLADPHLVLGPLAQLALLGAAVEQAHRHLEGVGHLPQQTDLLAAEHLRAEAGDQQRPLAVATDRGGDRVRSPGAGQIDHLGSPGRRRDQLSVGDISRIETGPALDPIGDDRGAVGREGGGNPFGGDPQRRRLIGLGGDQVEELGQLLGRPAPLPGRLVFHPQPSAYRQRALSARRPLRPDSPHSAPPPLDQAARRWGPPRATRSWRPTTVWTPARPR